MSLITFCTQLCCSAPGLFSNGIGEDALLCSILLCLVVSLATLPSCRDLVFIFAQCLAHRWEQMLNWRTKKMQAKHALRMFSFCMSNWAQCSNASVEWTVVWSTKWHAGQIAVENETVYLQSSELLSHKNVGIAALGQHTRPSSLVSCLRQWPVSAALEEICQGGWDGATKKSNPALSLSWHSSPADAGG